MVHRGWMRRQGRVQKGDCSDLVCGIGGVHQHDAGDIRDDTEARFYRARRGPEGGEGHHVVCVCVGRARAQHTIEK